MARTIFAPKSPDYEAFFDAVSAGALEKVKVALTPSMDVNGDTPLLSACGSSCVSSEIVELLLSKGAAVTARSGKPYTADIVKGDTPCEPLTREYID